MNAAGLVLIIVGLWAIAQLLGGDLLKRVGL
jgi:hypothetical protein